MSPSRAAVPIVSQLARQLHESRELLWAAMETTTFDVVHPTNEEIEGLVKTHGVLYIVSAENPGSRPSPNNEIRSDQLRGYLEANELHVVAEVDARSVEGRWSERSFALAGITEECARAVAQRFLQAAFFEVGENYVSVKSVA